MLTVVAGRPLRERGQDLLDRARVRLVPLVLGVHHRAGVHDLALGDERQDRDPRLLAPVARRRARRRRPGRGAHLGADVDPRGFRGATRARRASLGGRGCRRSRRTRSARRRAGRRSRRRASPPRAAGPASRTRRPRSGPRRPGGRSRSRPPGRGPWRTRPSASGRAAACRCASRPCGGTAPTSPGSRRRGRWRRAGDLALACRPRGKGKRRRSAVRISGSRTIVVAGSRCHRPRPAAVTKPYSAARPRPRRGVDHPRRGVRHDPLSTSEAVCCAPPRRYKGCGRAPVSSGTSLIGPLPSRGAYLLSSSRTTNTRGRGAQRLLLLDMRLNGAHHEALGAVVQGVDTHDAQLPALPDRDMIRALADVLPRDRCPTCLARRPAAGRRRPRVPQPPAGTTGRQGSRPIRVDRSTPPPARRTSRPLPRPRSTGPSLALRGRGRRASPRSSTANSLARPVSVGLGEEEAQERSCTTSRMVQKKATTPRRGCPVAAGAPPDPLRTGARNCALPKGSAGSPRASRTRAVLVLQARRSAGRGRGGLRPSR